MARRLCSISRPTRSTPGSTRRSAEGFYDDAGLDLQIREPGDPSGAEAARRRPHRLRDPRHPRPRDRPRAGPRHRRHDGDRPAPAGGGDRADRRPGRPAPRPRRPHRRRHRAALRRSRRRLRGERRRRRPGEGPPGHDRVQRRLRARRRQGRRGDRVLERRGASRSPGAASRTTSSRSTATALRPTRS